MPGPCSTSCPHESCPRQIEAESARLKKLVAERDLEMHWMPNTRKILIVDDDPEMREALTEQLSLHEEFEALAVENGSKGVPGGQGRADRSGDHGRGPARHRRP